MSEDTTRQRRRVSASTEVSVQRRRRGVVVEEHDNEPDPSVQVVNNHAAPVPMIRIGGSVTRNMGDFESVRVHVEVEVPIGFKDWDSINETYEELSSYVDARLADEVDLATGVKS